MNVVREPNFFLPQRARSIAQSSQRTLRLCVLCEKLCVPCGKILRDFVVKSIPMNGYDVSVRFNSFHAGACAEIHARQCGSRISGRFLPQKPGRHRDGRDNALLVVLLAFVDRFDGFQEERLRDSFRPCDVLRRCGQWTGRHGFSDHRLPCHAYTFLYHRLRKIASIRTQERIVHIRRLPGRSGHVHFHFIRIHECFCLLFIQGLGQHER